ncbi:MAG: hypothetical protein FWD90_02775 [Defluviitaleaceae bacterium]|nr:hypothetical protein [Defluviitaleaceae bacterium]
MKVFGNANLAVSFGFGAIFLAGACTATLALINGDFGFKPTCAFSGGGVDGDKMATVRAGIRIGLGVVEHFFAQVNVGFMLAGFRLFIVLGFDVSNLFTGDEGFVACSRQSSPLGGIQHAMYWNWILYKRPCSHFLSLIFCSL